MAKSVCIAFVKWVFLCLANCNCIVQFVYTVTLQYFSQYDLYFVHRVGQLKRDGRPLRSYRNDV